MYLVAHAIKAPLCTFGRHASWIVFKINYTREQYILENKICPITELIYVFIKVK